MPHQAHRLWILAAGLSSACATCPDPPAVTPTEAPITAAEPAPAEDAPTPTKPELTKPELTNLLKQPLAEHDQLEVVISRVVIPPNFTLPLHYHPGQEFVYTVEGSAIVKIKGEPDRVLKAGEAYVIPPRAHHSAVTTDEQATAIVFRVHDPGKPVRFLVKPSGEEVPAKQ